MVTNSILLLSEASWLKVHVRQLDFIGVFLQAKMRTRMFITIPKIYGTLFPEYDRYCGRPVRLIMSMYGTTLCGKYWYLDLLEYLLELGFRASESIRCLFITGLYPLRGIWEGRPRVLL
jgi:hypothetical protein